MKHPIVIALVAVTVFASAAQARDTRHSYAFQPVLEKYADRLEGVDFYLMGQSHPEPAKTMGEYQSNKKTNAFNKSDQEACEWVLLSALLSLRERALTEGGNAVIDIWSNYKKEKFVSDTEFMCGAGTLMAGVTLKGTVALIE